MHQIEGRARDLAMVNLATDSKLRGPDWTSTGRSTMSVRASPPWCSTKVSAAARLGQSQNLEETMKIIRRHLMLSGLAVGLLGVVPAFAGPDEDAIAKNLEAFRAAQA